MAETAFFSLKLYYVLRTGENAVNLRHMIKRNGVEYAVSTCQYFIRIVAANGLAPLWRSSYFPGSFSGSPYSTPQVSTRTVCMTWSL